MTIRRVPTGSGSSTRGLKGYSKLSSVLRRPTGLKGKGETSGEKGGGTYLTVRHWGGGGVLLSQPIVEKKKKKKWDEKTRIGRQQDLMLEIEQAAAILKRRG